MNRQHAGHSLLETLVSVAISALICIFCTQHALNALQIYLKINKKFRNQQEQLIAKYYITKDLEENPTAVSFCNETSVLHLIFLDHEVKYYVRKNELFRDDLVHNSIALVRGIIELQTQFYAINNDTYKVVVTLIFTNNQQLEISCVLDQTNKDLA